MPPEQYAQIKEITDQGGISMGEWVRDAIEGQLLKLQNKDELNNDE